MVDGPEILVRACDTIAADDIEGAAAIIGAEYPFVPLTNAGRRYSLKQYMQVFARDGFIDRYSGKRLVFPATLRLLSRLMPEAFPYHTNWKTDACHFAYYDLCPTIDHVVPVSRGGADDMANWVCTSQLRNSAKANFTLDELGWSLLPPGDLKAWDGLTGWFLEEYARRIELSEISHFREWAKVARLILSPREA